MHADLEAMVNDAERHGCGKLNPAWRDVAMKLRDAQLAVFKCMSERDQRSARG